MKKILVVDDDDAIREIFEIILNKAGFAVTMLADGDAVLEDRFEEPDLFLIDKQLKGIDGLDLCRHLKQRSSNCHTPVIIISASTRVDKAAKEAGADAFLEKPFKSKILIELIQKHLAAETA